MWWRWALCMVVLVEMRKHIHLCCDAGDEGEYTWCCGGGGEGGYTVW